MKVFGDIENALVKALSLTEALDFPYDNQMKSQVSFIALLLFISGCRATRDDVCSRTFPSFRDRLQAGLVALEPWREVAVAPVSKKKKSRSPASTSSIVMAERDRLAWRNWAEGKLLETQRYIDLVSHDPNHRDVYWKLNEVANHLVTFHVYAEKGNVARMLHVLGNVSVATEKAYARFCSQRL